MAKDKFNGKASGDVRAALKDGKDVTLYIEFVYQAATSDDSAIRCQQFHSSFDAAVADINEAMQTIGITANHELDWPFRIAATGTRAQFIQLSELPLVKRLHMKPV